MATGDPELDAKWQQLAIEIGHGIRSLVNTAEYIGTKNETGYVLMFFNVQDDHGGQSTIVSSATDRAQLKRLLKFALRNLNRARTVEPGIMQ